MYLSIRAAKIYRIHVNRFTLRNMHFAMRYKAAQSIQDKTTLLHRLSPTFTFTDLSHHRTCGSAYGGFLSYIQLLVVIH